MAVKTKKVEDKTVKYFEDILKEMTKLRKEVEKLNAKCKRVETIAPKLVYATTGKEVEMVNGKIVNEPKRPTFDGYKKGVQEW